MKPVFTLWSVPSCNPLCPVTLSMPSNRTFICMKCVRFCACQLNSLRHCGVFLARVHRYYYWRSAHERKVYGSICNYIESTHLWYFVVFPAPAPNTSYPDPGGLFWAQGLEAKKWIKCQMKLLIMEQFQRQLDKLFKKYVFAWFPCQWEDLECLVYFPLRTLHRCTQIYFPSLALKGLALTHFLLQTFFQTVRLINAIFFFKEEMLQSYFMELQKTV